MKHKLAVLLAIAMAVTLVLTGCAPAAVAPGSEASDAPEGDEAIKIAFIFPMSGDVKTYGESSYEGAMMAVEEARSRGMNVEVITTDDKCDAQEAANAANKVIFEDGVKFIVGAVCSSASVPVSEIAEANQILQISPASTNPVVTINEDGSVKEYVFRSCFLDPFQGEVMATLALELGGTSAAVLYDVGNDYVKGFAEYFRDSFEAGGGSVLVYEAYTKEDTDFSGVLGKVAEANVDILFLPDYYNKVNLIAAQAKEKGITATMLGGDGWDSPELQYSLLEGGYHSNHYSPDDPREVVQDFVTAYEAEYGHVPDALATLAYDAARILLQSIEEADSDDPSVVKDAMAAIQYTGVCGDIIFDAEHNPIKKAAIIHIENGKPVFFKFAEP